VQFVSFVLDDVQNTRERILPQSGANYEHAKLVLFRDYTKSGCGTAQSATGPFYCPEDEKVYIDLAFFDELRAGFVTNPLEVGLDVAIGRQIASFYQRDKRVITELYQPRRLGTHLLDDRRGSLDQGFGWYAVTVPSRAAYVETGGFQIIPRHLGMRCAVSFDLL
jgi:hypothetical protein